MDPRNLDGPATAGLRDEAQNFAPSMASTAIKASAIALARQGRKFGLGMIFATQAPKGIDTNIVSNCVTHWRHAARPRGTLVR